MEEEASTHSIEAPPNTSSPELISVCKCLLSGAGSSEEINLPKRKRKIFSTVSRTETYLRERRIPELIRYMLAKIIAANAKNPVLYTERLLDECMIFRSGLGRAPVVFEERHLEAVVKSFDPGQRGWLSAGQVRRAYITLGLTPETEIKERTPTQELLDNLRETQERELFSLLNAGTQAEEDEFGVDVTD